jgi:hypothetical protein
LDVPLFDLAEAAFGVVTLDAGVGGLTLRFTAEDRTGCGRLAIRFVDFDLRLLVAIWLSCSQRQHQELSLTRAPIGGAKEGSRAYTRDSSAARPRKKAIS